MKNVQSSSKLDLIRKSDVALEKLAAIFDKSNFEFTFDHKQFGILRFITEHENSHDEESLKQLKNGIACLDHLVHAHNREMKPWVKNIAKICVKLVNLYKNNSENLFLVT